MATIVTQTVVSEDDPAFQNPTKPVGAGPEFNGYDVDFDEAMRRQGMYKAEEIEADHKCKIGRG